jgi:DNA N-6-adenine-methyltransferase (Dam)
MSNLTSPPQRYYQSKSVEWYTPPELFEALGTHFDLDPAAPSGGVPWVPATRHYSREDDGLTQPWKGRIWLNPPYGLGIGRWMNKLAEHGDGLALVFARTDMPWFQWAMTEATAVCFIKHRLTFIPGEETFTPRPASAPSVLLAYGVPCALATAESGVGQICLTPRSRELA